VNMLTWTLSYALLLALSPSPAKNQPDAEHSCSTGARSLFREQQYARAEAQAEECLRESPQDDGAIEILGLIEAVQGDRERAEALLNRALKLAPENNEYRFNMGVFLAKNEQIEVANKVVEPLLSSKPDADLDNLVGYLRLRQRQEREAVSWFQKALVQAPNSIESEYRLGFSYHSLGEFDKAISCYRKVLELQPEHFFARLQLGKLLLAEGEYEEAELELIQSARIRPPYAPTWRYLSEAQLFMGQKQAAVDSARTAVEDDPEDPRNHYQLGVAFERMGESTSAAVELRKMAELRARQVGNGPILDPLEY
jgi:Flp pilus assembly protein TadD